MAIQFDDVIKDDVEARAEIASKVGIVLFGEGGKWLAQAGKNEPVVGLGVPNNLPSGIWVYGMEYDKVRALPSQRGVSMRAESWLKLSLGQIESAFGTTGMALEKKSPILAGIADRAFCLVQEAIFDNRAAYGYRTASSYSSILEKSPSLATGIAGVASVSLKLSGVSDKKIADEFEQTYQSGMFFKGRKYDEDGSILLNFHFPRLSYALKLTEGDVPGHSRWQSARKSDDMSSAQFIEEMEELDRPAIYKAVCSPTAPFIPEYIEAFANGVGRDTGGAFRTRFTADEVRVLQEFYRVDIQGALAGEKWQSSVIGKLLRSLEASCGGPEAARASWSAGLAAENILAAAFRSIKGDAPSSRAEAIWLAARDRVQMAEAVQKLTDMGASLVSANCGNITVRCPLDKEVLMVVVNAAWELGLILPLDDVSKMKKCGVEMPIDPALFGGNPQDLLLSAVVHQGNRNAVWTLDGVMDAPKGERAAAYRSLMP